MNKENISKVENNEKLKEILRNIFFQHKKEIEEIQSDLLMVKSEESKVALEKLLRDKKCNEDYRFILDTINYLELQGVDVGDLLKEYK